MENKRDLLIALMAFYGLIREYEVRKNKAFLVNDICVLIDFCDEHNLTDINIHEGNSIGNMLANLIIREDLISWLQKEKENQQ